MMQMESQTLLLTTDYLWSFVIWVLAFELYLSFASLRQFAGLHGPQT
jgi:hypothetical protein